MDIFYDGTKHCKKCGRDLPNNSLYFPTDKNCKDGLRNVCRECNPKYKRFLEIGHRTNDKWSESDLSLLKSIYKNYTNEEIKDQFFPNRTIRSIETIASKYKFNYKNEDAIKRGIEQGAIKNSEIQKGRKFTEKHKNNISMGLKKRYEDPEQRKLARQNALKRGLGKGDLAPAKKNPLYGEKNGRWNGGASNLIEQLRRDILDWKKKSSEFCDYKCIITGNRFQNIHHIISFNSIVEESLNELKLNRRSKISDYSESEYFAIRQLVINKHNDTYFGACLCKEIHELFHKEYSYYDSTNYDFIEFIHRIADGYYDEYLRNNRIDKNINIKYLDYLESAAS